MKESIQMLVVYVRVLCLQGEAARKEWVGKIDSFADRARTQGVHLLRCPSEFPPRAGYETSAVRE